jgi:transposase
LPNCPLKLRQGPSCGSVLLLHQLAKRLGIVAALGSDRQGKLALWQVIARVIDQGCCLSAVRLATHHAACELLHLDSFNESHLYANLAWLADNQGRIEARLFKHLYPERVPEVFLYDVTSSYLEGKHNFFAAWGFSRDGKPGKAQLIIGLLCDGQGNALSIQVFGGNLSDPKTLGCQIKKAVERFGAQGVTFVGDRGMIKGPQVKELGQAGFHYITAITKPQIQSLLKQQVLQMGLFDTTVAEVSVTEENVRYILRRNPQRAQEMAHSRHSKQAALERELKQANQYLAEHGQAWVSTAVRKLSQRIQKLKLDVWLKVKEQGRSLLFEVDEAALAEATKLDGCYVLKTDLPAERADKHLVHERYKDLSLVEESFRTCKTVQLEMRPVHVQLEASTRGHAFVVMLAYRLVKELERCWSQEDLTVSQGINQLSSLCQTEIVVGGEVKDRQVPEPRDQLKKLVDLAKVKLPERIGVSRVKVSTKQKLVGHRPRRSK